MNTYIKPIESITGRKTELGSGVSSSRKIKMIKRHLNTSKYELLGFLDRTNEAVLRPRYYNVRDSIGRFAPVVEA
jgi:hypothetical protein